MDNLARLLLADNFNRGAARVLILDAVDIYTNPDHPAVQATGNTEAARYQETFLAPIQEFVDAIRPRIKPIWIAHAAQMRREPEGEVIHSLDHAAAFKSFHGVRPQPEDLKISKSFFSAFQETPLERRLIEENVRTLILAGFTTRECILHTAWQGALHGFEMILATDLSADFYLDFLPDSEINDFFACNMTRYARLSSSRELLEIAHD